MKETYKTVQEFDQMGILATKAKFSIAHGSGPAY